MGNDNPEDKAVSTQEPAMMTANSVSIKTPVFSETSPLTWFAILEAQFSIKGITVSQTKFHHALANLTTDAIDTASFAVIESKDYDLLKTTIVAAYQRSKPELFDKLISSTTMTGRPSACLRELRTLATKVNVDDDLIRHKFVQSLPSSIAPAVAAQKRLTLDELGTLADELMPLTSQINKVFENKNGKRDYQKPEKKNPQNNIPFAYRPFYKDQRPKICRAHLYFANEARTCKPWCKYPDKTRCSVQPSSRPSSRSSSPAREEEQGNASGGRP